MNIVKFLINFIEFYNFLYATQINYKYYYNNLPR